MVFEVRLLVSSLLCACVAADAMGSYRFGGARLKRYGMPLLWVINKHLKSQGKPYNKAFGDMDQEPVSGKNISTGKSPDHAEIQPSDPISTFQSNQQVPEESGNVDYDAEFAVDDEWIGDIDDAAILNQPTVNLANQAKCDTSEDDADFGRFQHALHSCAAPRFVCC